MAACLDITVVTLGLALYFCATLGHGFKDYHAVSCDSCRLAHFTASSVTDSLIGCAVDCLSEKLLNNCAAYQWNAYTGACYMQNKLNITGGKATGDCYVTATDCSAILSADPTSKSGVYNVLVGTQEFRQVWCDMDTDGGGWTVFLKRLDGSVDFNLNREAYKQGFGNVNGEYWLGLDALQFLTSSRTYQLRADISDWEGTAVHSLYSSMLISDEADNYRLTHGSFLGGEGGDALSLVNGQMFSTKDLDLDVHPGDCAELFHGGFWYKDCLRANPTGKYYVGGSYSNDIHDGMQWRTWAAHDDKYYSMKTLELKIRPYGN